MEEAEPAVEDGGLVVAARARIAKELLRAFDLDPALPEGPLDAGMTTFVYALASTAMLEPDVPERVRALAFGFYVSFEAPAVRLSEVLADTMSVLPPAASP